MILRRATSAAAAESGGACAARACVGLACRVQHRVRNAPEEADLFFALFDDAPAPRVLLARFHPFADDSEIVAVGRVVCEGERAWIEPIAVSGLFAMTAGMLAKLRYLIERSAPCPFERLPALRSRFWSFVEIDPSRKEPDA
jgi:hypothetical protein